MEKLIVDRGNLLTGTAQKISGSETLRDPKTGLMCILGQYGQQCLRLLDTQLNYKSTLSEVGYEDGVEIPSWLSRKLEATDTRSGVNGDVEDALITTNDGKLHPTRREARTKKLFKKYGDVEVTFTGRYADATKTARRAYANRD